MTALSTMINAQKRAARIAAQIEYLTATTPEQRAEEAKGKRRAAFKAYYANRTPEEAERVRRQRADTRHRTKANAAVHSPIGQHEEHLAWCLRNEGLETTPQQRCGRYKIDLGAWPLAIEVSTSGSRPENFKGKRIEHLISHGWSVLYVVITPGLRHHETTEIKRRRRQETTFSTSLARHIVDLRNQILHDKTPRYVSCGSLGEVKSEGSLDSDGQLAVIQRQKYRAMVGSATDSNEF